MPGFAGMHNILGSPVIWVKFTGFSAFSILRKMRGDCLESNTCIKSPISRARSAGGPVLKWTAQMAVKVEQALATKGKATLCARLIKAAASNARNQPWATRFSTRKLGTPFWRSAPIQGI